MTIIENRRLGWGPESKVEVKRGRAKTRKERREERKHERGMKSG